MSPEAALRLRAEDKEDLAVISACLQDALVSVADLAYDPAGRSFMLVANRFRWECTPAEGEGGEFERVLCALGFEEVESVAYRGFRRTEQERILSLLAIHQDEARTAIDLAFAGGVTIRLNAAEIRCRLRDFGEPWPTSWQPDHPLEDRA